MNKLKISIAIIVVACVALSFQNCSNYQSAGPSERSFQSGNGDPYTGIGNGDPYTGMLSKSGVYRNLAFDYLCQDGTTLRGLQETARLMVDLDNNTAEITDNCSRQSVTINLDDINVPHHDADNLIYSGGIYEYYHSLQDGPPNGQDQYDPVYRAVHCSTDDTDSSAASTDLVITRNVQTGVFQVEAYFTAAGNMTSMQEEVVGTRGTDGVVFRTADTTATTETTLAISHISGSGFQESYDGVLTRTRLDGSRVIRSVVCTVDRSVLN